MKIIQGRRVRDFGIYFALSTVCCVIVIFVATRDIAEDQIMRLVGFILFTVLTFGFFVEKSKYVWRSCLFWGLTGTVVSAHSLVFARLLFLGKPIPLSRFVLVSIVEVALLLVIRNVVLGYDPSRSGSNSK